MFNNNVGLKWVTQYPLTEYSDYNVDYKIIVAVLVIL